MIAYIIRQHLVFRDSCGADISKYQFYVGWNTDDETQWTDDRSQAFQFKTKRDAKALALGLDPARVLLIVKVAR